MYMKPGRVVSVLVTSAGLTLAAWAQNTGGAARPKQHELFVAAAIADCQAEYSMNAPRDVAMNEDLKVTFTAPSGHDPKGWIGVFLSGDDPKKANPVTRQTVEAAHKCSGSVTLKGVPTGDYDIYYFLDAGRERVGARGKLTAHTPV
jgi:hypothetical protein